jgi:hypothetical protein
VSLRETLGNAVHPSTNSGKMSELNILERFKAGISHLLLIPA